MSIELYAQLYGLPHAVHANRPGEEEELDRYIEDYADAVVEQEKASFESDPAGLETLGTHISRMRQQVVTAMHDYYDHLGRGYKVICDALVDAGMPRPEVAEENLKIFGDLDAFTLAQREGRAIYELLGYTLETLTNFYTVLDSLFQRGAFEKVRDGFYFMITIGPKTEEYSPLIAHYWKSLGLAETKLECYDKAEEAFLKVIECQPTLLDGYLGCLNAYEKQNMFTEADQLCDQGIAFAEENSEAEWAAPFIQTLTAAKSELKADTKEEV